MSSPTYIVLGSPSPLATGYAWYQSPSTLSKLIFCIKNELSCSPAFLIIFSPLGTALGVGAGDGIEVGVGFGFCVGVTVGEDMGMRLGLELGMGGIVCLIATK